MQKPMKAVIPDDKKRDPSGAAGPTSPAPAEGETREGPKTGTYDDRPPDKIPDNKKGGYGAG